MIAPSAVRIAEVGKSFGAVKALGRVDLDIPQGELFGCIGADGAGKTTLFRIICTLLLPDRGRAEVLGFDSVSDFREIRRRLGYMPGRFSLYQDLSVEENLRFFAAVFGTTVGENYDLIKDIYTQLEPFRERRAGKLSGGMKQKLALCCALVHRPELLVLDEPTTGVDAVSRREFWQMLKRLKAEGITILVSTPYMDEAVLCDRIAFLQKGSVLGVDTPCGITGLFTRPLYAVRARQKYRLITALRRYPHAASAYAFGGSVHYSDKRPAADLRDLLAWLDASGLEDAGITQIEPGIEDAFMALMELQGETGTEGADG
ncbi:ABC transporter ATP-binding protein [Chlorobium sp.]|jgi:ABC-2 type transport system ATP-binding protein|uniref:ABC transporter ATP-binding protein n=1 Tax=Chlorobium sp. TaxID=1095 RepID=UPI003C37A419|nr:ABC transporter ATP-binding protein [Chlorobiaceae bacterium]NTW94770.1 ABC transporter ATP-binding protein [Chlorobiaceae bacterium]